MRIGVYLKRVDWGDPNVASDRIRGEWVMKCRPEMEEWKSGVAYDAVIFHNAVPRIAGTRGVKILDVCDPMWPDRAVFRRLVQPVDGLVTTTEELRRQIMELTPKPVRVIGDGHWLPFYETRVPNPHSEPAKTVVWFGYADNVGPLRPLIPILAANGLKLKVIAERNPFPPCPLVEFVRWCRDTFVREISRADFAVLPFVAPHKSDNKDVTALLAGVPVAKTAGDIVRLVDPLWRQWEMAKAPGIIARHDVRDRAREYMEWIGELAWIEELRRTG